MVYYYSPVNEGLISADGNRDGYSIRLKWNPAYPSNTTNGVAYNIFMSTVEENVFTEGVKYISINGSTSADIIDLMPGQLYFFAVRAVEYSPLIFSALSEIPTLTEGLIVPPSSTLVGNITASSLIIPVLDAEIFSSSGVVQIGYEMIQYLSVDTVNNNLILTNISQRGFFNTNERFHTTDGYDGYNIIYPPLVTFTLGREELNTRVYQCQARFEFPDYQLTLADGYHQVTNDILTTNLSASDAFNAGFPSYDYAGWHRTNPADLLTGVCVGSYIGGQQYCADGYSGVGRMLRGMSLQTQNNQRQEMLLNVTGEPVCLIKRVTTGITCSCYTPEREYADDRCPLCYGSKFVVGYQQFFNPRRSDGRILIRFSPADDDLIMNDAGLESTFTVDCWTLVFPTIKDRDIIVRFDQDGNEEYRYEVLYVNRNKTIESLSGAQKFKVQRIRKYDPAYQIRIFRNTEFFPQTLETSSAFTTGLPAHTHDIVVNEGITSLLQINQTTGISQSHNHPVVNGQVMPVLGHTHTIILPES